MHQLHARACDAQMLGSHGNASALGARPTTLSVTGYDRVTWPPAPLDHGASWMATYVAYGMGFGLLVHDMVERFLLHYFAMSAHTYTRGSWTTPEGTIPDRDRGSTDYVAAGVVIAPTYLKWMLLFEEPNTRTVWLAKALPREWLGADAGEPVEVLDATTRYGRVSYTLRAEGGSGGAAAGGGVEEKAGGGATLAVVGERHAACHICERHRSAGRPAAAAAHAAPLCGKDDRCERGRQGVGGLRRAGRDGRLCDRPNDLGAAGQPAGCQTSWRSSR